MAKTWQIDLSTWETMAELEQWQDVVSSSRAKDISIEMAKVVKSWPYDSDPSDPASYSALKPSEWAQCLKEVGIAVSDIFQAALESVQ